MSEHAFSGVSCRDDSTPVDNTPKRIWQYIKKESGNLIAPELASGSGSGLYSVVFDARLSRKKSAELRSITCKCNP